METTIVELFKAAKDLVTNPLVQGAVALVAPLGLYAYSKLFKLNSIADNCDHIDRDMTNHAKLLGLNPKQIKDGPLDLNSVGSLLVANAEFINMTYKDSKDAQPRILSARLDTPTGRSIMALAHGMMDNPQDVLALFSQIDGNRVEQNTLKRIKKDMKTWARPTFVQNILSLLSRQSAFSQRVSSIQDTLNFAAGVLIESAKLQSPKPSEQNDATKHEALFEEDKSGPCHMAFSRVRKNGLIDVVVMPTTQEEAKIIDGILGKDDQLPTHVKQPSTIREALIEHNRPLAASYNQHRQSLKAA